MTLKKVLTIAGSDCSGGAGVQADIKTVAAHHLYAMSVITAVTAQNTLGVQSIFPVSPDAVAAQLDSIFCDIPPDAVKIGMVYSAAAVHVIAEKLMQYHAMRVIIDPVLVSTSGRILLQDDARDALVEELFPLAELITPNLDEEHILHMQLCCVQGAVLVKGGHASASPDDILFPSGKLLEKYNGADCCGIPGAVCFSGTRIGNPNTHGTGCTLSSAIACGRAQGLSIEESVRKAKAYITGAIQAGLQLGHGRGPLDHGWQSCSYFSFGR